MLFCWILNVSVVIADHTQLDFAPLPARDGGGDAVLDREAVLATLKHDESGTVADVAAWPVHERGDERACGRDALSWRARVVDVRYLLSRPLSKKEEEEKNTHAHKHNMRQQRSGLFKGIAGFGVFLLLLLLLLL